MAWVTLSPDGGGNAPCPNRRGKPLLGLGEGGIVWLLALGQNGANHALPAVLPVSLPFLLPLPHFFDNSSPVGTYLMGGLSIH